MSGAFSFSRSVERADVAAEMGAQFADVGDARLAGTRPATPEPGGFEQPGKARKTGDFDIGLGHLIHQSVDLLVIYLRLQALDFQLRLDKLA
jgi:hypothetical protein